jgi:SH3-like domain-containing protein
VSSDSATACAAGSAVAVRDRRALTPNAAVRWTAFWFAAAVLIAVNSSPATAQTAPSPSTPVAGNNRAALFAAIGESAAIVYDAPSLKAQKTFILARTQPVEVLVKLDKWVKIRDADNTIGWVEGSALGERRFVQVAAASADIRAAAETGGELVFEAQRAVLLEVLGPAIDGWLPVRHRDGESGYVRKSQVWGD